MVHLSDESGGRRLFLPDDVVSERSRSRRQAETGSDVTGTSRLTGRSMADYSAQGGANVEFIHPKMRDEHGDSDEDPDNPFVWLTSYARVPVSFETDLLFGRLNVGR